MESLNFNSNGPVTGTGPIFIRSRNIQGCEFNSPLKIDSGSGTCPMSVGPEGGTGPITGPVSGVGPFFIKFGGAQGGGIIKKDHGIDISAVGSTTGYLPMVTGNDPTANQNSNGTGTGSLTIH